ncbi:MAG: methyltransferase domain-containing protein [Sulfurovum sp.]|nr:methyltransferase domain-containing protein [Sulfurovum sp.]
MKIQREFSQNARAYDEVNVIQKKVVQELLKKIDDTPRRLLDIGCGNGTLFKAIDWQIETFVGMDFAEGMLTLHPKKNGVILLQRDFNTPDAFKGLEGHRFERIVSASALQWATDLNATLEAIAAMNAPVSLAIFTSGTFKILYQTAGLSPILRDRETVISLLNSHFGGEIQLLHYTLGFDSVREMFRYMKRSGVGAGRNVLGYSEMKHLMETYPLDHLEYEIVLLHETTMEERSQKIL